MCNDYERHIEWDTYRKAIESLEWDVPTGQSEADLPQAAHVRVRDIASVIRAAGNSVELTRMRWSFPPSRPGGKPVFNFRSEGRRFGDSNRCLTPASAFFEFTGDRSPKTRHRFSLVGHPFMCIAGLWREGADGEPPNFTMLTTEPGPDILPVHNRQVVVLLPRDWPAWIYLTKPEGELLRSLPAGSLEEEATRRGA